MQHPFFRVSHRAGLQRLEPFARGPVGGERALLIDQQKSFYWSENTIDKWQSYIKEPRPVIVEQPATERKKNVDAFVLGFYNRIAAGHRIGNDYATGTVAVDASGNVTGSGTTFTSAMVGKGFTADGLSKWYRIVTFTSTTAIVIQLDAFDDSVTTYDGGVIARHDVRDPGEHGDRSHWLDHRPEDPGVETASTATKSRQTTAIWFTPRLAQYVPEGTGIALERARGLRRSRPTRLLTDLFGFKIYASARVLGDNMNG